MRVALAGVLAVYLATSLKPRISLLAAGLIVAAFALVAAVFVLTETLPFAHAEATRSKARARDTISTNPGSARGVRAGHMAGSDLHGFVTGRQRREGRPCLMWALAPVFLLAKTSLTARQP